MPWNGQKRSATHAVRLYQNAAHISRTATFYGEWFLSFWKGTPEQNGSSTQLRFIFRMNPAASSYCLIHPLFGFVAHTLTQPSCVPPTRRYLCLRLPEHLHLPMQTAQLLLKSLHSKHHQQSGLLRRKKAQFPRAIKIKMLLMKNSDIWTVHVLNQSLQQSILY